MPFTFIMLTALYVYWGFRDIRRCKENNDITYGYAAMVDAFFAGAALIVVIHTIWG